MARLETAKPPIEIDKSGGMPHSLSYTERRRPDTVNRDTLVAIINIDIPWFKLVGG